MYIFTNPAVFFNIVQKGGGGQTNVKKQCSQGDQPGGYALRKYIVYMSPILKKVGIPNIGQTHTI